jgi:hypothetical protein
MGKMSYTGQFVPYLKLCSSLRQAVQNCGLIYKHPVLLFILSFSTDAACLLHLSQRRQTNIHKIFSKVTFFGSYITARLPVAPSRGQKFRPLTLCLCTHLGAIRIPTDR